MARIKAGFRSSKGSSRDLTVGFIIHRTATRGVGAFEACVKGRSGRRETPDDRCAYGRNPRQAVGNAMQKFGRALKKRKGAFQGL